MLRVSQYIGEPNPATPYDLPVVCRLLCIAEESVMILKRQYVALLHVLRLSKFQRETRG